MPLEIRLKFRFVCEFKGNILGFDRLQFSGREFQLVTTLIRSQKQCFLAFMPLLRSNHLHQRNERYTGTCQFTAITLYSSNSNPKQQVYWWSVTFIIILQSQSLEWLNEAVGIGLVPNQSCVPTYIPHRNSCYDTDGYINLPDITVPAVTCGQTS